MPRLATLSYGESDKLNTVSSTSTTCRKAAEGVDRGRRGRGLLSTLSDIRLLERHSVTSLQVRLPNDSIFTRSLKI